MQSSETALRGESEPEMSDVYSVLKYLSQKLCKTGKKVIFFYVTDEEIREIK